MGMGVYGHEIEMEGIWGVEFCEGRVYGWEGRQMGEIVDGVRHANALQCLNVSPGNGADAVLVLEVSGDVDPLQARPRHHPLAPISMTIGGMAKGMWASVRGRTSTAA